MLDKVQIDKILEIWNTYDSSSKIVKDTKGNPIDDIDKLRRDCFPELTGYIESFYKNKITIGEFKTLIDSFNKRNNYWGFTATKGQMFFNQLVKASNESEITKLLQKLLTVPDDIKVAAEKINELETYCNKYFLKANDKRKVPNPRSSCYFLSYFWQIFDHNKWPIMYTSLVEAFTEIGIWSEFESQSSTYEYFYKLNDNIILTIQTATGKTISYWDLEHAFWDFYDNRTKKILGKEKDDRADKESRSVISVNFDINDYIIPKISKLIELGEDDSKTAAKKGYEFEKVVAEVFKQLDFDTEILGQGTGRNPDVIAKIREENTAFLIDAKAYSKGYSLGLDDRAISEYINTHCPKLVKDGYKKIGFIIVSNSFRTDFDEFINEVTWNTEIKRFILITSEALLYLLAYRTKDKLGLQEIINCLVSLGNPITSDKIISNFEDV
ncbi:restriction endonuclease FokI C-terminal domain-containing protein [Treponema sp. OMZ 788]|uniref:restriction endonuclease FokI C-terminal domain-containing protein n=1 Tax=Treponema sp. OMZ 788 TaxID=2563664 RepID=UPI0020A4FBE6|nr:restriction endonuclease FokI C-terminal domain-containing protein [Treponema sp. OMZ 788]